MQTVISTTYSDAEFDAKIIGLVAKAIKPITEQLSNKNHFTGKKILTIDEAADFTSLSKSRIYALASDGKIPNFKKGNRLYFYEAELFAWLESGSCHSGEEINIMADNSLKAS